MKRAISDPKLSGRVGSAFHSRLRAPSQPTLSRLLKLAAGSKAADPKALLEQVAETYRNLKRYQFDFTLLTDIRSAAGRKSVETHIELTNYPAR